MLFAANRPLISSKLRRLPTRGMLGNGLRVVMGAVAAFNGKIAVTTRGHRYDLTVDTATGHTLVEEMPALHTQGTRIELVFPEPLFDEDAYKNARTTIALKWSGYPGGAHPRWYGPTALRETLAAAPQGATVGEIVADLFGIDIDYPRPAGSLSVAEVQELLDQLGNPPEYPFEEIGPAFGGYYHRVHGHANIDGAEIPFCVEAWISCRVAKREDETRFYMEPFINRSPALARLNYAPDSLGLNLWGCGLDFKVSGAKRAVYHIKLSLITPYLRLTGDGKAPDLANFSDALEEAVQKAATTAYRNMTRPPATMSIKDAAWAVMKKAYLKASDNGRLPANARQIMYAARPDILRLTGKEKLNDAYFTQTLLPNYQAAHHEETDGWDIVYDARGHFIEPHTSRQVALGTLEVRQYLGEKTSLGPAVELTASDLYPTSGPVNRYKTVLFVEKEGFDPLFRAARLAEKYDLAIMSTKGMSVTAARLLLDRITPNIKKILVLHDFDVTGFTISGTLGGDNRRYTFDNAVKIVNLGLRLEDAEDMGLAAETVEIDSRAARRDTLERHGATDDEIEFLIPEDETEDCQRIELNAMTSRQLIDFIEEKLAEHHVEKLVPSSDTLAVHARRLQEQVFARKLLEAQAEELARKAATVELPADLDGLVRELLKEDPELSWDAALAQLIQ
jgi:hypothetical protein